MVPRKVFSMKLSGLVIVVMALGLLCVSANAVSIPLSDSGWSIVVTAESVGGGSVGVASVYGVSNDAVTIELDKTFNHRFDGQYYEPVSIQFLKTSADAVSNIVINDEYVINETGTEWFDFHMTLVSAQAPMAGFNSNYSPDGHQLEDVYYSNNVGYNGLPIELNFEDTDGHGVLSGVFGYDVFQPGYDSGKIVIVTNPNMQIGDSFVLREVPTPEPMTVFLLGMGGLAILKKKKRAAV